MAKFGQKPISKHDIIRGVNTLNIRLSACESKIQDLDVLLMEFIEMMGKQKEFEKYLDGKYKQKERKRSGTGIITSSKWFDSIW